MMFYPSCPNCGGKTESAEADSIEHANRHAGHWLHTQALQNHPHPFLKLASVAVTVGRQVYKRVPGGGEKRCTICSHTFR